jgi:uncharacterized protein YdeI (YjbR/CyaY-like superfamily)
MNAERPSKSPNAGDKPIRLFRNARAWATWLDKNHSTSSGLWLRLAKKASGLTSVSYDDALDVALCYGWIDGLRKSDGETHFIQLFTPRRKRSVWSKRNRAKAIALIKSGQMKLPGLAEVERAKNDGRWDAAYDSPSKSSVPDDLQRALNKNVRAKAFFTKLDSRNRYAICFRVQTAVKPETRAKRIQDFVTMLSQKKKLYP